MKKKKKKKNYSFEMNKSIPRAGSDAPIIMRVHPRRERGWLAILAWEFGETASYVEESVMYRVKGHAMYDPDFGESFDKTIDIKSQREDFYKRLKLLDDHLNLLLEHNPDLLFSGLRKRYATAPDLERTDYALLHHELEVWMGYSQMLQRLDENVDDPCNEAPCP